MSGVRLVMQDKAVRALRCDGMAGRDGAAPWTAATVTQVGSVSKQFVAAVALLLSSQGILDLEAPVADLLPAAGPAWRTVSMVRLLTHTAGVPHWGQLRGFDPAQPMAPADRLAAVLAAPLTAPAGTAWAYSSPGYLVAAAVAEAVAGSSYAQLASELIIRPLELADTTAGRRPAGAAQPFRAGAAIEGWDLSSMPGTGDIWSTARDIATFAAAVYDGTLLPATAHDSLLATRVPLPGILSSTEGRIERTHYGLGHFVGSVDGAHARLLAGDNPGFLAMAAWLPDTAGAVVALSNDDADDVQAAVVTSLDDV